MNEVSNINLAESKKEYQITADVRDTNAEDIHVRIEGNGVVLEIKDFYQFIPLKEAIDGQKIGARFLNGVLTVKIRKAEHDLRVQ